ncbi:Facilitated trehalose transporter Tret1 [Orchesella cincta]|uniref:Facilitated trehalose transporter Tret1 n=1 Tax=Orchesella cincta TaxID=48709 RepID=A0A1D2MBN0_ORCCI|nr:Facilitated trehalose transporter Tret1 [Orchesella cincta]
MFKPEHSNLNQPNIMCQICLAGFLGGTNTGWSSTALPSIKESGDFIVSSSDLSWIASVVNLGGVFSAPAAGFLIRKFGRRTTLLLSAIPYTIGWVALSIPMQVWMLYGGRFLSGVGLGLTLIAGSVYLSEISEPEIRGRLSVIWFVAIRFGTLFAYGIGSVLTYDEVSVISAAISVAFGICAYFLPESPRWLMSKWRVQQAIDSLCWLRACDKKSPSSKILGEIEEIKEAVIRAEKATEGLTISTYFTNRAVLKSIVIASILMLFREACGGRVFSYYAVQVFDKTGSAFDSHISGIIVGVSQLFSILITTYLVDKVGRRILLILTLIIMSLALLCVGIFYEFKNEIEELMLNSGWIPLIAFVIYHAANSGGPFVLTYTVSSEIIPTNVIASVSGLIMGLSWIAAFVLARFYEDMNTALGVSITFWLYAVLSVLGALCVWLLVPETNGKSLENIHKEQEQKSNGIVTTLPVKSGEEPFDKCEVSHYPNNMKD